MEIEMSSLKRLTDRLKLIDPAGNNVWDRGKHRGKLVKELPQHYLEWVTRTFETDQLGYILCKHELERRWVNGELHAKSPRR